MKHTYKITGMTCISCEEKVKNSLLQVKNVTSVTVSKDTELVIITMDKHVALNDLKEALDTKYNIETPAEVEVNEEVKSWFEIYKPILLIFFYIVLVTTIMALQSMKSNQMEPTEIVMKWMNHFMGGFFLAFSFFKLLDLNGFAASYKMYDIIAKKIPFWAYLYPFVELGLGLSFLSNLFPLVTNSITFIVMSISIIGVLQAVLNKKKIQCACLGAVFNLPMSTITIIEDALMILMSGIMVFVLI
ncbi:heavy-metal-associated domain-containing protein [Flavobacterium helocola]|uniref:MauE/DoxX family redox-associated membrane protein n=1 Tax=Flavobacterium helocola TaxID=3139139 RepID=A0ABU9I8J6_9FLAO